ncbi:hypothetical protein ACOMHN_001045 [Nucella lapillus]
MKANPATFITLSHTVLKALRCVQDLHTKTHICDTIPSFFSFLWNASITLERQPDITPRQVCLVRLSSLRLLAQLPLKREFCLEKLLLALSVFEYQSRRVSGTSEGVLKKEEPQGEKKSAGVHKSKTTKNIPGKKGSDVVSENAGKVEERSDGSSLDEFVLPLVFDTLEDVLRGGYVSAVLVLKLILTLYDVFASCKIAQHMDEVKGKVTSLVESSSCPASSEIILHVLDPLWALINITEHVCEDSAALSFCETDLECRFISAVNWCRQKHLRTPVEKRSFVELFHKADKKQENQKQFPSPD